MHIPSFSALCWMIINNFLFFFYNAMWSSKGPAIVTVLGRWRPRWKKITRYFIQHNAWFPLAVSDRNRLRNLQILQKSMCFFRFKCKMLKQSDSNIYLYSPCGRWPRFKEQRSSSTWRTLERPGQFYFSWSLKQNMSVFCFFLVFGFGFSFLVFVVESQSPVTWQRLVKNLPSFVCLTSGVRALSVASCFEVCPQQHGQSSFCCPSGILSESVLQIIWLTYCAWLFHNLALESLLWASNYIYLDKINNWDRMSDLV